MKITPLLRNMQYLMLLVPLYVNAQKNPEITVAFLNNHTAYPFASFASLFSGPFHPGGEVGYRFDWTNRKRHDWYQTANAGYFYHRFLQHGIHLHTQTGYRFKATEQWRLSAAFGFGYLQSIPATAVYKLGDDGSYEKAKGIGRAQATAHLSLGTQYYFKISKRPFSIFTDYRQTIQAPFVRSYVPFLPYNSFLVGLSTFLHQNRKS